MFGSLAFFFSSHGPRWQGSPFAKLVPFKNLQLICQINGHYYGLSTAIEQKISSCKNNFLGSVYGKVLADRQKRDPRGTILLHVLMSLLGRWSPKWSLQGQLLSLLFPTTGEWTFLEIAQFMRDESAGRVLRCWVCVCYSVGFLRKKRKYWFVDQVRSMKRRETRALCRPPFIVRCFEKLTNTNKRGVILTGKTITVRAKKEGGGVIWTTMR